MAPDASEAEVRDALESLGHALVDDLRELFGHEASWHLEENDGLSLIVEGPDGRLGMRWPPDEGLVDAEGPLGARARIALELQMAAETPSQFWDGHVPVSQERRRFVFDRLRFYLQDSLGETGYYDDLIVEERGPALLIYSDDEYCLVSEDGQRRGHGILEWKVRRLVAYALTDADDTFDPTTDRTVALDDRPPGT